MSRWIDADALIKEIKQDISDNGLTERYVFYRINDAPSIDIVRCEECKWWNKLHGCIKNDDVNLCTNADDFCSYGERREP